mmetsp:Transcript_14414/g.36757  ORF Transcript_14414/g.36757 Transcript_14414/m.36757 type:complete len:202 (+) Transcript_14414:1017-1622(+)
MLTTIGAEVLSITALPFCGIHPSKSIMIVAINALTTSAADMGETCLTSTTLQSFSHSLFAHSCPPTAEGGGKKAAARASGLLRLFSGLLSLSLPPTHLFCIATTSAIISVVTELRPNRDEANRTSGGAALTRVRVEREGTESRGGGGGREVIRCFHSLSAIARYSGDGSLKKREKKGETHGTASAPPVFILRVISSSMLRT